MIFRWLAAIVVALVVLLAVALGYRAWQHATLYPDTDDASISAPVVTITAVVPGTIVEVLVEDNHHVSEGQLLFRIDPTVYELEVAQARAVLASAESELRQGEGNLTLLQSNADVAAQQIVRAENNLAWAKATLARLEPLLAQKYVTAQEVETARTAVEDATVTLEQAIAAAGGSQAVVGTLDTRRAQVELARAGLAVAERNLAHTEIRAPRSGVLSGMKLTAGEFVVSAVPLFTLIDNNAWQVSALFRETELPHIRIGDRARVFLLSAPTQAIEGRVTGIGWGIRSTDEANLFGLPLVSSSLNWVRSAKRFPVEIHLENPPVELTRLGASASVRILGPE